MKELRCRGNSKAWRVAFAFTPEQRALVLAGWQKSSGKEGRFYKELIGKADARLTEHLEDMTKKERAASNNT